MCVGRGSGRLRASTVGLNIKNGCIPACSGMAWTWKDMLVCQFFTEKAWGTRKRPLFTSSLEPTQILAFFSVTLLFFFLFFFSSLYSLLTSALLRGYVSNSQDGRTGWDEYDRSIFTQTNMRTLTCTDATVGLRHKASLWNSGGLMGHPLVALWSSSVKVYALSHMGKEPCDLFLLSGMIILLAVDVYHRFSRFVLIHHIYTNTNTQIQKWCVILHLAKQVSHILHHLYKKKEDRKRSHNHFKVSIMVIDVL